jgi:hypothetical protein
VICPSETASVADCRLRAQFLNRVCKPEVDLLIAPVRQCGHRTRLIGYWSIGAGEHKYGS